MNPADAQTLVGSWRQACDEARANAVGLELGDLDTLVRVQESCASLLEEGLLHDEAGLAKVLAWANLGAPHHIDYGRPCLGSTPPPGAAGPQQQRTLRRHLYQLIAAPSPAERANLHCRAPEVFGSLDMAARLRSEDAVAASRPPLLQDALSAMCHAAAPAGGCPLRFQVASLRQAAHAVRSTWASRRRSFSSLAAGVKADQSYSRPAVTGPATERRADHSDLPALGFLPSGPPGSSLHSPGAVLQRVVEFCRRVRMAFLVKFLNLTELFADKAGCVSYLVSLDHRNYWKLHRTASAATDTPSLREEVVLALYARARARWYTHGEPPSRSVPTKDKSRVLDFAEVATNMQLRIAHRLAAEYIERRNVIIAAPPGCGTRTAILFHLLERGITTPSAKVLHMVVCPKARIASWLSAAEFRIGASATDRKVCVLREKGPHVTQFEEDYARMLDTAVSSLRRQSASGGAPPRRGGADSSAAPASGSDRILPTTSLLVMSEEVFLHLCGGYFLGKTYSDTLVIDNKDRSSAGGVSAMAGVAACIVQARLLFRQRVLLVSEHPGEVASLDAAWAAACVVAPKFFGGYLSYFLGPTLKDLGMKNAFRKPPQKGPQAGKLYVQALHKAIQSYLSALRGGAEGWGGAAPPAPPSLFKRFVLGVFVADWVKATRASKAADTRAKPGERRRAAAPGEGWALNASAMSVDAAFEDLQRTPEATFLDHTVLTRAEVGCITDRLLQVIGPRVACLLKDVVSAQQEAAERAAAPHDKQHHSHAQEHSRILEFVVRCGMSALQRRAVLLLSRHAARTVDTAERDGGARRRRGGTQATGGGVFGGTVPGSGSAAEEEGDSTATAMPAPGADGAPLPTQRSYVHTVASAANLIARVAVHPYLAMSVALQACGDTPLRDDVQGVWTPQASRSGGGAEEGAVEAEAAVPPWQSPGGVAAAVSSPELPWAASPAGLAGSSGSRVPSPVPPLPSPPGSPGGPPQAKRRRRGSSSTAHVAQVGVGGAAGQRGAAPTGTPVLPQEPRATQLRGVFCETGPGEAQGAYTTLAARRSSGVLASLHLLLLEMAARLQDGYVHRVVIFCRRGASFDLLRWYLRNDEALAVHAFGEGDAAPAAPQLQRSAPLPDRVFAASTSKQRDAQNRVAFEGFCTTHKGLLVMVSHGVVPCVDYSLTDTLVAFDCHMECSALRQVIQRARGVQHEEMLRLIRLIPTEHPGGGSGDTAPVSLALDAEVAARQLRAACGESRSSEGLQAAPSQPANSSWAADGDAAVPSEKIEFASNTERTMAYYAVRRIVSAEYSKRVADSVFAQIRSLAAMLSSGEAAGVSDEPLAISPHLLESMELAEKVDPASSPPTVDLVGPQELHPVLQRCGAAGGGDGDTEEGLAALPRLFPGLHGVRLEVDADGLLASQEQDDDFSMLACASPSSVASLVFPVGSVLVVPGGAVR